MPVIPILIAVNRADKKRARSGRFPRAKVKLRLPGKGKVRKANVG